MDAKNGDGVAAPIGERTEAVVEAVFGDEFIVFDWGGATVVGVEIISDSTRSLENWPRMRNAVRRWEWRRGSMLLLSWIKREY